jgi:AraC-like DNA-binding protein
LSAASPGTIEAILNDKKEDEFVRRLREAIEKHLMDADFSVEQLCKLVFMSHSQLHRKLDALTGCSPNKFIRMIRLKRAMQLLKDPSNSIASVALDCGYNDPGYFARIFKQEHGMTPQEWRCEQQIGLFKLNCSLKDYKFKTYKILFRFLEILWMMNTRITNIIIKESSIILNQLSTIFIGLRYIRRITVII